MGRCRRGPRILEWTGLLSSILENFRSFERNETARHHAIKYGQECIDFFPGIDDLNHDRQILREAQKLAGMNAAGMAESDVASQDSCAGEVHLPRL